MKEIITDRDIERNNNTINELLKIKDTTERTTAVQKALNNAIHNIDFYPNCDLIKRLLENGELIDNDFLTYRRYNIGDGKTGNILQFLMNQLILNGEPNGIENNIKNIISSIYGREGINKEKLFAPNDTSFNMPLLYQALRGGYTELVDKILPFATISLSRDDYGMNALHHACYRNDVTTETIDKILRKAPENEKSHILNAETYYMQKTPLSFALENKNYAVVNCLLTHGAAPKLSQVLCSIFSSQVSTHNMFTNYVSSTATGIIEACQKTVSGIVYDLTRIKDSINKLFSTATQEQQYQRN